MFGLGGGSRPTPILSFRPPRGTRAPLTSSVSIPVPSGNGGGGGNPNADSSPSKGTVDMAGSHRKVDRAGGHNPKMVDLPRNQLDHLPKSKESKAKVGAMAAKMRGPRSRGSGSGSGGSAGGGSGSDTRERLAVATGKRSQRAKDMYFVR